MKEYQNVAEVSEVEESKGIYDLEERTYSFAKRVRDFIKKLPRTISNNEDISQLTRCSGSAAANYIEANESISKKDFAYRIKICRKEAKESRLFLRLIETGNSDDLVIEKDLLIKEAHELVLIFASILRKTVL
jgi:four helix bundle protein